MRGVVVGLCLVVITATALGQGTLNFSNRVPLFGIDAPVTCINGVRPSGPDYWGQLYVLNPATASFEAVGVPTPFRSEPTWAGYITGGLVEVPFVAPGARSDVMLRAWAASSGATWEVASANPTGAIGESLPVFVPSFGNSSPNGSLPADLIGLQGFTLLGTCIPEPSTLVLAVLGLAGFGRLALCW